MHADPIKISIFRATCADLCNFNLICCKLIKILFIYSRRSRGFSTWMWAQRGSSLPIRASKHHISNLQQITMCQWWHLTMRLNYTRSRLFTQMLSKIHIYCHKMPHRYSSQNISLSQVPILFLSQLSACYCCLGILYCSVPRLSEWEDSMLWANWMNNENTGREIKSCIGLNLQVLPSLIDVIVHGRNIFS